MGRKTWMANKERREGRGKTVKSSKTIVEGRVGRE